MGEKDKLNKDDFMRIGTKIGLVLAFLVVLASLILVSVVQTSEPKADLVNSERIHSTEKVTEKSTRPPEEKSTNPTKSNFSKKKLESVEKKVTTRLENMNFNGTFLIAVGDETIYHKAFGYSDVENKKKNTLTTKYEIGSCTKQFTATAVAKLAEEKKLSLSDKVIKYVPKAKLAKDIKIYQLMNMCSGLPDYLNEFIGLVEAEERSVKKKFTQAEFLDWLNKQDIIFNPGEYFSYSNTNYYLLGMVIESVTGQSYEDYITDEILYPLYMDNTSLSMKDTNCKGYLDSDFTKGLKLDSSLFYSAGEMVSTTGDMLKWVNALSRKKVIGEKTLYDATHAGKDGFNYGYGWFGTDDYYYHTGNTELYYAIDIVSRKDDIKVIGLSNVNDTSLQQNGLIILQNVEDILFPNSHNKATEPTK